MNKFTEQTLTFSESGKKHLQTENENYQSNRIAMMLKFYEKISMRNSV